MSNIKISVTVERPSDTGCREAVLLKEVRFDDTGNYQITILRDSIDAGFERVGGLEGENDQLVVLIEQENNARPSISS
jgi:hypothetical protein